MSVLLAVQVTTIVSVMLSYQEFATDQVTSRSYARLQDIADRFSSQVSRFLRPAQGTLYSARRILTSPGSTGEIEQRLQKHFLRQLRQNTAIRGIALANPDGSYLTAERREDTVLLRRKQPDGHTILVTEISLVQKEEWRRSRIPDTGFEPRRRPWFREAVAHRSMVWTRPYRMFASNAPGLSVALPVPEEASRLSSGIPGSDDRDAMQVLAVHVAVADLSRLIATVPGSQDGSAALVDHDFQTIAYSRAYSSVTASKLQHDLSLQNIARTPMQAFNEALQERREHDEHTGSDPVGDGFVSFRVDGATHLGVALPFPLEYGDADWRLLVQAPAADYDGGLRQDFVQRLWTLIGVISLSSVIAILLIFRLTAPVYEMHRRSTHDRLTGALTREELERRVARMADQWPDRRITQRQVLVALDLDGFKQVNDVHGHAAGDQVLCRIVDRLGAQLGPHDLIGRVGGDEFVMALWIANERDVMTCVEQLRDRAVAMPIESEVGRLSVGMTAGVALRQIAEPVSSAVMRADQALIEGKRTGKNQSYLASAVPRGDASRSVLRLRQTPDAEAADKAARSRHRFRRSQPALRVVPTAREVEHDL